MVEFFYVIQLFNSTVPEEVEEPSSGRFAPLIDTSNEYLELQEDINSFGDY